VIVACPPARIIGAIGPTRRPCSLSTDHRKFVTRSAVEPPGWRGVTRERTPRT
jgi:hypothetical protein